MMQDLRHNWFILQGGSTGSTMLNIITGSAGLAGIDEWQGARYNLPCWKSIVTLMWRSFFVRIRLVIYGL
jgi:hypothetical protein